MIAGGMFAAEIGRLAGVRIPVVPMSHEYIVTQPFRERDPANPLPTLRDPDLLIYFREEGGGLVMGGYERPARRAFLPTTGRLRRASRRTSTAACSRRTGTASRRSSRTRAGACPAMEDVKVTRMINGPEAFTPDGEFCLGETEVRGLFVAAGFCAHGLAGAGGVGKAMAEWIAGGEPSLDLWQMDVRRFGAHYRSPVVHAEARSRETYETYYDIKYPDHERQAGRPLRVSPVVRLAPRARRRVRREVRLGAGQLVRARTRRRGDEALRPRGWAGQHWSPAIGAEHARLPRGAPRSSTRPRSPSSRSTGPGAAELLERLCDNRVAREVGRITYTQMLNSRGGIECDFTVARLGEDRFSIVTGTAFGNHDRAWIRAPLPATARRAGRRRRPRAGPASGCGGRGRATCSRRCTPRTLANEASPT